MRRVRCEVAEGEKKRVALRFDGNGLDDDDSAKSSLANHHRAMGSLQEQESIARGWLRLKDRKLAGLSDLQNKL